MPTQTPYDRLVIGTRGLVAYWPMKETSTDVQVWDQGRVNNLTGTCGGNTTGAFAGPSRAIPTSRNFVTTGTVATAGDVLEAPTQIGLEFWCRWTGSGTQTPFAKTNANGNTIDWQFQTISSKMNCGLGSTTAGSYWISTTSATNVPTSKWSYWALTFDGTTLRLYKDGMLDASSTSTSGTRRAATTNITTVGILNSIQGWVGEVACAAIYNRALTSAETYDRWLIGSGQRTVTSDSP